MFGLIVIAAASPAPQLFPSGFSPLLARYEPAPQAPASTVHADHVAAVNPVSYVATYPYVSNKLHARNAFHLFIECRKKKQKKNKLLNSKPFKFQVRFAIPEVYGYKYAYY